MNLVLSETDEFRRVKRKGGAKNKDGEDEEEEDEMKRTLGLVILRGETIVTLSGAFLLPFSRNHRQSVLIPSVYSRGPSPG